MFGNWLAGFRKYAILTTAALLASAGLGRAGDDEAELRRLVEQQGKQIQELKKQLEAINAQTAAPADGKADAPKKDDGKPRLDEDAVKKIIAQYLQDNPGAGMPPSVQTGFQTGSGFVIRSAPNPTYVPWADESRIPFELRIRGRVQLDYYNYKTTDDTNHFTGRTLQTANANAVRFPDFSQEEVKRLRLVMEGTAFSPDLRYHFELDGNTRGLGGVQNNKVIQTSGAFAPNAAATSPIGGGVTVDHAVRLFSAYVAYDFHGCSYEKGCGPDCAEGTFKYAPTYTLIVGKLKPFFGIEEVLGSANEQLVEYSMADWFFDADDDNLLMGAGTQIKAFEDRFYLQALVTNGNESQFPNTQMDKYPGFNVGFWYDFGGNWNRARNRWDLFGDSLADIDYSCKPVIRVGAAADIVPQDRRSLYGDDEQSRVFVTPGGPGGTRLINVLNGDGATATPVGSHAVDKFDYYTYDAFVCGHYKGFSLMNEWWYRDLNNFHTTPNGRGNIIYTDGSGANALFPANHALTDYGMQLQGGYFIVPKKLEVVARWSWIRGDSGDINGNERFRTVTIPGVTGGVRVIDGAFRNYHEANEYAVGVNYYFKRQLLKWQTDLGFYTGGNPAGGGSSPAGFIPGQDGYMLRTQLQLAF
jgi:hypothetical protein